MFLSRLADHYDLQGQQLDATFKIRRQIDMHFLEDDELYTKVRLFSCPLDDAPENKKHISVRKEGSIGIRFQDHEVTTSRWNKKLNAVAYKFKYEVEVDFRAEQGILSFKTFMGSRQAGVTTISFDG